MTAIAGFWKLLLSLLYRERCAACKAWSAEPLCEACLAQWPCLPEALCPQCAEPSKSAPCPSCQAQPYAFTRAVAAGAYTGVARAALLALKYHGRRRLAPLLAARLELPGDLPPGGWLVVPVPLHRSKLKKRGYNQALLLARAVAKSLSLPCRDLLQRRQETAPQHSLNRQSRLENLAGAFACRAALNGKSVLLVDDVLTTGATAHAAAHELLKAGASEVRVLVVARTLPPGYPGGESKI